MTSQKNSSDDDKNKPEENQVTPQGTTTETPTEKNKKIVLTLKIKLKKIKALKVIRRPIIVIINYNIYQRLNGT